jgi:catechol 2,3-dioxygenase-like lactoylglutathione lyase family enzyme
MINIQAIDHVVLRVRDLEKMTRFYVDVLGARVEKNNEMLGLYQLRVGTALIDFVPVESRLGRSGGAAPGREGRNVDHICFRVLPWDGAAIAKYLEAHGLDGEIVSRYGAEGDGPSIYVTDPEGNNLELKGPPWAPVPKR